MLARHDALAPEWAGETVFIVAGGPSVAQQNLDLLRGRHIIAVNSSYERLPQFGAPPPHLPHVDLLIFGDNRWWELRDAAGSFVHRARVASLGCPVVTVAGRVDLAAYPIIVKLAKHRSPGLSQNRAALAMRKTTLTAAINAAAFKAPGGRIVLLGADGKFAGDGKTRNHYPTAYTFPHRDGTWDRHRAELAAIVQPLAAMGITVVNASPGSAWDLWPIVRLEDVA